MLLENTERSDNIFCTQSAASNLPCQSKLPSPIKNSELSLAVPLPTRLAANLAIRTHRSLSALVAVDYQPDCGQKK